MIFVTIVTVREINVHIAILDFVSLQLTVLHYLWAFNVIMSVSDVFNARKLLVYTIYGESRRDVVTKVDFQRDLDFRFLEPIKWFIKTSAFLYVVDDVWSLGLISRCYSILHIKQYSRPQLMTPFWTKPQWVSWWRPNQNIEVSIKLK